MTRSVIILCALLMLLFFLLTACAPASAETAIRFLRIGQADAIIITHGETAILVDAGEDDDGEEILAKLRQQNIRNLDAMIITHFDKDHVGSADHVLGGIPVAMVYDAAYEADSKQYRQYNDALESAGLPRVRVEEPVALAFGNLVMSLMPTKLSPDGDNDNSLVLSITDEYHTFFLAADAEEARIEELLDNGLSRHDLVKMPHHGRDKQNLDAFLDALNPRIAVITDSDKNPAEEDALKKLSTRGIDTYTTKSGDILIISNEKGLTVTQ